ncbi:MAG: uracil-DNA glycosylase [Aureliella sp.]
MNEPLQLSPDQLRVGLSQILRSYASAGIKRVDTAASAAWTADFVQHLSAVQATSAPVSRQPSSVALPPSPSPSTAEPAPPLAPAAVATAAVASPTAAPAPLLAGDRAVADAVMSPPAMQWQLPPLSVADREQRLAELNAQVRACRKCEELVCYRRQTVFGEGDLRPRVCFYGEAPGAEEDAQGRPFVGAAGKLLTDIIRAMRLKREDVYILNSLKCRPPQNRTPLPQEVENCRPYALAQLEILQPEFIILLGAVAVRSVLQSTDSVGRLRGRFHQFHGARVLVTYHPAYLLRNADAKKLVWADVQLVMRELGVL